MLLSSRAQQFALSPTDLDRGGWDTGFGSPFSSPSSPSNSGRGIGALGTLAGLGDFLSLIPEGVDQTVWARSLVSDDYCQRLACGAITQEEAGLTNSLACGIAYPKKPMGWCSDVCRPYLPELRSKYGQGICPPAGVVTSPVQVATPQAPAPLPPAPIPVQTLNAPMPSIVSPAPPVTNQQLPKALQPKVERIDPVTCPDCGGSDCPVQIGGCCVNSNQLLGVVAVLVLAMVVR